MCTKACAVKNADSKVLAALIYQLRCKEDSLIVNNSVCATLEVLTISWANRASRNPNGKEEEWAVVATKNDNNA